MIAAVEGLAAQLGVSAEEALEALVHLGVANTELLRQLCSTYRRRRKYTVPKLAEFGTDERTAEVRHAIGSTSDGPLTVGELVSFLRAQENVTPEWRLRRLPSPDGMPRKRGRPRKQP
jgi:hypothetical protein